MRSRYINNALYHHLTISPSTPIEPLHLLAVNIHMIDIDVFV